MPRVVLVLIAVLGAAVAGAGLWFAENPLSVGYGWTAYSPLSATAFRPVIGAPWWSLTMVVAGSVALGAALALLLVRRGSRSRGPAPTPPGRTR